MRPRKFSREQAAVILRIFANLHTDGKKTFGAYCFNQYMAAQDVIDLFGRCWEQTDSGAGQHTDPRALKALAVVIETETDEAFELSCLVCGMSPRGLVQQVKRWRKRLHEKH